MRTVFLAFLFLLLALLFAPSVRADSEARQGADWVRVTALPCTDAAVVALITQAGGDPVDWRAAQAEFGGKPFAACWQPVFAEQRALLVYSDGDSGYVPFAALHPLKEA
jgi:hypothetical protein